VDRTAEKSGVVSRNGSIERGQIPPSPTVVPPSPVKSHRAPSAPSASPKLSPVAPPRSRESEVPDLADIDFSRINDKHHTPGVHRSSSQTQVCVQVLSFFFNIYVSITLFCVHVHCACNL
jgi:hypothetical protein